MNRKSLPGIRALGCALLVSIALQPVHAETADAAGARAVIERLHGALLENMKAGEERGFGERVAALGPVVEASFHIDRITDLVLGRHASDLDDGQLARVSQRLERLTARQFASRFDRFNGEQFTDMEVQDPAGNRVLVDTTLVKGDGERISLDYMLQHRDGRWGIVNVIADGVSDLAMKRSELSGLLRREGFPALIEELDQQIAEIGPQ